MADESDEQGLDDIWWQPQLLLATATGQMPHQRLRNEQSQLFSPEDFERKVIEHPPYHQQ